MAASTGPSNGDSRGAFDVPGWLTEITGVGGWSVQRTFTRRKVEFVATYGGTGGATAEVTLQALPAATNSSWQLIAKTGKQMAGAVIPARTRISW